VWTALGSLSLRASYARLVTSGLATARQACPAVLLARGGRLGGRVFLGGGGSVWTSLLSASTSFSIDFCACVSCRVKLLSNTGLGRSRPATPRPPPAAPQAPSPCHGDAVAEMPAQPADDATDCRAREDRRGNRIPTSAADAIPPHAPCWVPSRAYGRGPCPSRSLSMTATS